MGEAPDATILVQDVAEAEALELPAGTPVAYVTQTTLSVDETAEIIGALRRRFPDVMGPKKEDICYATSNRQWAVKDMLAEIDLLLVIGSRNSSNSNRLVDVARAADVPSHLIDDETEIDETWLDGVRTVGITSGASAPEQLVTRACDWFRARGVDRHRAVPHGRRGRHLPPPRRAAPRAGARGREQTGLARAHDRRRVAAVRLERRASVSALIQSACASRSASARGSVSAMRSVSARPGLLAQRVDPVDQVVDAALERAARRRASWSSATRRRRPSRRPPSPRGPAARRAPRRARARGRRRGSARRPSSSNSPAASAARTAPSSRPEPRPEHRQVRLDAELGGLDRARTRPPSRAARRAISSGEPVGERARPRRRGAASGWRSLTPEVERALAPELDDPPDLGHLVEQRAVRRRAPRASRRGRPSPARPRTRSRTSALPEVLGEERHDRRDHAQRLHERVPERRAARPRRRPRSGGASGGCTSSRGRRRTPRRRGSRRRSR